MEAGRLNHRITIQRPIKSQSKSNQTKTDWKDYLTLWAEIQCTDSTAVSTDGAIQHEGLYKFYIRYTEGITAEMRIKYGKKSDGSDRIFILTGPPADWKGERIGLTLLAKELV